MRTQASRQAFHGQLFPRGIPRLWCPTLTHFRAAREPDATRICAHLSELAHDVRGILVPGSTGEGWEMSDADIRALLAIVLEAAAGLGVRVLIGVLKTNVDDMLACLDAMEEFRVHAAVAGFTICPPTGAALTQSEITNSLRHVLARGWPTALYQLPQITQNEMSAETVAALAKEFPNFILFKDTSGFDRVALSGLDFRGVFMVRGAEVGGYARWPRAAGGPYDGFLLSTANVFARELAEMLRLLDAGDVEAAHTLSAKLADVVGAAFAIVAGFPHGNAFANANKVLDHCMAHGEDAMLLEPPLLYSGARLPADFISRGVELLRAYALLPAHGYLA
jgi:dihydrodipicolinate synthase/N-acetylneuraminate lyase